MKPVLLLAAGLLSASALPALAQTGAGTPPLNPNAIPQISQTLKLPGSAQPGTLTTSRGAYKSGQPVRMTFKVINTSGKRVTYNFGSGQRYDITATNAAGTQVWSWSHGKLFTQNLASVSIAPGKALVYHAVWNGYDSHRRGPVAPGVYTLNAHLTSNNQPAITGGVIVNTDPDPDNMGVATRTPAESGTIRQVAPAAQVSAKTTITIK
jgi:hypothetical protein